MEGALGDGSVGFADVAGRATAAAAVLGPIAPPGAYGTAPDSALAVRENVASVDVGKASFVGVHGPILREGTKLHKTPVVV
jgi:hypothetical protein